MSKVIAAASYESQKYFFEPVFGDLPEDIKNEIRIICVVMAQRLGCSFIMGFKDTGDVYFEIVKPELAYDFDDIGADLEIKSLTREKEELIKALKVWYLYKKELKEGESR